MENLVYFMDAIRIQDPKVLNNKHSLAVSLNLDTSVAPKSFAETAMHSLNMALCSSVLPIRRRSESVSGC